MRYKTVNVGTSLAVQWLRPVLPTQGTWVQSLVEELRSQITAQHGLKERKREREKEKKAKPCKCSKISTMKKNRPEKIWKEIEILTY